MIEVAGVRIKAAMMPYRITRLLNESDDKPALTDVFLVFVSIVFVLLMLRSTLSRLIKFVNPLTLFWANLAAAHRQPVLISIRFISWS
jgi:TRAP-type uncharacterized transport system fused permease subunit